MFDVCAQYMWVYKDQSCRKVKVYNEIRKGLSPTTRVSLNVTVFKIHNEILGFHRHIKQMHHSEGVSLILVVPNEKASKIHLRGEAEMK